jgi:hypothetical protein
VFQKQDYLALGHSFLLSYIRGWWQLDLFHKLEKLMWIVRKMKDEETKSVKPVDFKHPETLKV